MGLFKKMREPVFLKESGSSEEQLEKLKLLEPFLNEEGKAKLRQEIKHLEYGINGEKEIAFELRNSHFPMYIIHDLYLKDGDLTSQIDYLVVTRKICFIIECKNLYGDIEIDSQGTFVRTMEFGGQKKREGIYSPITQNQRHMALLKKLRLEKSGGILKRFFWERYFESDHRAIVVLANPRTILNARYADEEIKNQVIRADQLVDFIRNTCENSTSPELSDKDFQNWAQFYLYLNQENKTDYLKKYEIYKIPQNNEGMRTRKFSENNRAILPAPERRESLIKDLRVYRWNTSQAEGIKPYFVFNDRQMMDLIDKFPRNEQELKCVSGFGEVKVKKYGGQILAILNRYRKEK